MLYFLFIIIINQREKRTQNENFGHYHSEINTYYKTGLELGLRWRFLSEYPCAGSIRTYHQILHAGSIYTVE